MNLAARGYDVNLAKTGRDAVNLALTQSPGCILLDLNLPDCSGWEVVERLRAAKDYTIPPIAVISSSEPSARELADYGVSGYLKKPFDVKALLSLVNHLMASIHR